MTRFFKGVGVGTYLHSTNLIAFGIAPANPGAAFDCNMAIQHISSGPGNSPCISLTKSYAVAEAYARTGLFPPSPTTPAYVYEFDIPDPAPAGATIVDPVFVVAAQHNNPLTSPSYHHNGGPNFLLGVVSPKAHGGFLSAHPPTPPGASSVIARPPNMSAELQTMVFALRDAEVLVVGNIQRAWVIQRYNIY
jgi:hypothetical protein